MLATILRNTRLGIRRAPLLHALVFRSGVSRVGRRLYEAQALRRGEISVVLMGHRLRFSIRSPREIRRIDSLDAEEAFLARMISAIRPNDVFFDVGANIGVISLVIARAKPAVQIHAFEPEPRNAEALRRNVALNGLTDRIQVHELALGSEDGTAMLHVAGEVGEGTHSLVPAAANGRREIPIQVETVVRFCERTGVLPAVVKIDVEGAEGAVLKGMQPLLDREAVRSVFIEWHPQALMSLGDTPKSLAERCFGERYDGEWACHREPEDQEEYSIMQ